MKCCPACGQTLPDPELIKGITFRGKKQVILQAVFKAGKHGICNERLVELLYADDREGGPENPNNTISAHVWAINKILRPRGLQIRSSAIGRRASDGGYVLGPAP